MSNLKFLRILLRVADWICIRILLIILGLVLAELALRVVGYRPWISNPLDEVRSHYFEFEPELGWLVRPQTETLIWSGEKKHSETILANHTRLVPPSNQISQLPSALIVGDSSIYGWGLNDEDTLASRLALEVPTWRFINGAIPGYGALQSYLRTRQLLPQLHPQLVIMGYADYFTDRDLGLLAWTIPVADHSITKNVILPYAELRGEQLSINPASPFFPELPGRRHFATVRLIEALMSGIPAISRHRHSTEITVKIMQNWAEFSVSHGATPVVLLWNNSGQLNQLSASLSQIGIRVIDCSHPSQGDPETVVDDIGHPSAAVVRSWAVCLRSRLSDIFIHSTGNN
jgi:hypothetical protein